MTLNSVNSENNINFSEDFISYEKATPDLYLKCKVRNLSFEGMHIESDFPYELNENVDFNLFNFVNLAKNDNLRFPKSKIKWKKELQSSFFKYGYGIQFDRPYQDIEKFITNTKEKTQASLPNNLKIIGFTASLAYFLLIIFIALKRIGESFDLFMIGFGLISFAKIIRIITKDNKVKNLATGPTYNNVN